MKKPIALIVIDMQKTMCSLSRPPRNNPQAEENIERILGAWRCSANPVVCVRHIDRSPSSGFAAGQSGAEFQERFLPKRNEHVVEKNVPDAFINTGLERWLHMRGIDHVVIVGVSTNNSVEATARTAGNLGFTTVVLSDATFAFDKRDFGGNWRSAEEVHLMALANLDGDYAHIRSTDDMLKEVGAQQC